jgi:hypothetical protein
LATDILGLALLGALATGVTLISEAEIDCSDVQAARNKIQVVLMKMLTGLMFSSCLII